MAREGAKALDGAARIWRNQALRVRFGVEEQNRSTVSRLIREAVESGAIVPADPGAAPKLMRYLPFWATAPREGRA